MDHLVKLAETFLKCGCDDPLAIELATEVIAYANSKFQEELEKDYHE